MNVRNYISEIAEEANPSKKTGYYHVLKDALDANMFETSVIATTNYNEFIKDILEQDIAFLNGSTELWYDPYINRIGTKEALSDAEKHILVPLMFTQSGTKPMTSIDMSVRYVKTYQAWRESDAVVVVGFGFGTDDEHINGIIRTLLDIDNKTVIIITLDQPIDDATLAKEYAQKLKTLKADQIKIIRVDEVGKVIGTEKQWPEVLMQWN